MNYFQFTKWIQECKRLGIQTLGEFFAIACNSTEGGDIYADM